MIYNKYFNFSLVLFVLISFLLAIFNSYFFEINIFGDRDLIRAENLFQNFEVYGYEFGMQGGRRIPGGFYYYYLAFLDIFSKKIIVKNYFSFFFTILSFLFFFKLNKNIFNKLDLKLSLIFFLSSTCFLQQTSIFWNPSFGLPFSILGISFFVYFIENPKKIILFLCFTFIFFASQFHISYISFIFIFFLFLIALRNSKIIPIISILISSFILCYFPFILTLFFPLLDTDHNSYNIIQNSSSRFIDDFNIFTWFIKKQLINFNLILNEISKLISFSIIFIYIIFFSLLIILFFGTLRIYKLLKYKLSKNILTTNISICILLVVILIFTLANPDLPNLIFVIPTVLIVFIVLIFNKKFSIESEDLILKNNFYLIFYLYFFIFFVTNLGYLFTYGQLANIINGSNRFTLGILPVYALLNGISVSILIKTSYKSLYNFKTLLTIFLTIIFLVFHVIYAGYFVLDKNKNNSFVLQKEAIDRVGSEFNLSEENFINRVGFLKYENNSILPIEKVGLSFYIKNKNFNLNNSETNNCFLIVFNTNNIFKIGNFEKYLNQFFTENRDNIVISKLIKFKNYYLVEYIDENHMCINNINNDYIFTDEEKKIETFLHKKKSQESFKFVNNNITEYYFNLLSKDFSIPLNIFLELETLEDELNIKIISKMLSNSSTKLNGFWDEVQFYRPKIIFKNLENNISKVYLLNKKAIGNDLYKSPIKYSKIKLPKGNYQIIFKIDKINYLFKNINLNDINFEIDKNFNLNYKNDYR